MRRSWTVLIAVATLGLIAGVSRADVMKTFDASGHFVSGSTLNGTVTIDVTSGVITAGDLVVSAPDALTFTVIQFQQANFPVAGDYQVDFATAANPSGLPNLDLGFPTGSLVGYAGGSIGSIDQPANGAASDVFFSSTSQDLLVSGNFTAAMPLPSSAWMGLGLLGVVLAGSRLRRRHAAA